MKIIFLTILIVSMVMNVKDIEELIKKKIPNAKVVVKDLVGDSNHFSAEIVSK